MNVGNVSFYDGDGQRIGHVAGQLFDFALLFDDAGTPSDPSDDILLEVTDLAVASSSPSSVRLSFRR